MARHNIAEALRFWRVRKRAHYLRTGREQWRLSVLLGCGIHEVS